jgi:hypothetical protein
VEERPSPAASVRTPVNRAAALSTVRATAPAPETPNDKPAPSPTSIDTSSGASARAAIEPVTPAAGAARPSPRTCRRVSTGTSRPSGPGTLTTSPYARTVLVPSALLNTVDRGVR